MIFKNIEIKRGKIEFYCTEIELSKLRKEIGELKDDDSNATLYFHFVDSSPETWTTVTNEMDIEMLEFMLEECDSKLDLISIYVEDIDLQDLAIYQLKKEILNVLSYIDKP